MERGGVKTIIYDREAIEATEKLDVRQRASGKAGPKD
jgi:hypothetical protein